jgi:hypothetical protein
MYIYGDMEKYSKEEILMILQLLDTSNRPKTPVIESYIMKLNIFSKKFDLIKLNFEFRLSSDFCVVNDSLYFLAGNTNVISGGSGHDAIFKSTDDGNTWRKVLDLYSSISKIPNQSEFGIQKIAFKNDSVGIAVGQFGKIIYTYDGGESWIYETNLPPFLGSGESSPPTMVIEYAGDTPIIGAFNGTIHIMTEDTFAPKPEDTLTITGKIISDDSLAITCIPIRLNSNRITMTDKEGNYKFTKLSHGSYTVNCLNKYYDGANPLYYYEPFLYSPVHTFDLTTDTSGIDFLASNIRGSSEVTGSIIKNGTGLANIEVLLVGDKLHKDTTNEDGFYSFQNIGKWNKPYNLFPNDTIYNYEPESYSLYINENIPNQNFVAEPTSSVKRNYVINSHLEIEFFNYGDLLNLKVNSQIESNHFKLQLQSIEGRIIEERVNNLTIGLNEFQVRLSNLNTGVYMLNLFESGKHIITRKIIITR